MAEPNIPPGFDFTDPDLCWKRMPAEELAELRRTAPVWWNAQARGASGFDDEGYWVVTKHVYVAPTDAEALAEAREPQMWYRDSFIRSMSAEGLAGLHESVYRGAEATIARLSAQTWENLVENALIIGSPDTPRPGTISARSGIAAAVEMAGMISGMAVAERADCSITANCALSCSTCSRRSHGTATRSSRRSRNAPATPTVRVRA